MYFTVTLLCCIRKQTSALAKKSNERSVTFEHSVMCYTLALPHMLQILFANEADERSVTLECSL